MKSKLSSPRASNLGALSLLVLLAVPLPAFSASPDYDIVSCGTRESVSENGFIARILLEESNFGSGEVQIVEMYFPPDYKTQAHTHGSEEIFYVIEGAFGHYVNGEGRMLQPGEMGIARIGDKVEHITGPDSPARVLVIWVPGGEWAPAAEDTRRSWEMLSCP
jgi:quercetin dioxygenase-like cupin family protein